VYFLDNVYDICTTYKRARRDSMVKIRCLRPYTQLKGVLCNISIAMDFSDDDSHSTGLFISCHGLYMSRGTVQHRSRVLLRKSVLGQATRRPGRNQ